MDVKKLKLGESYAGKYGAERTITHMTDTHVKYTAAGEPSKTTKEKFAKWAHEAPVSAPQLSSSTA